MNAEEMNRCTACYQCPMGVVRCDNDTVPHSHGGCEICSECGMSYYKVHPHSNVCSKGTPIMNNVKHDDYHLKRQLQCSCFK